MELLKNIYIICIIHFTEFRNRIRIVTESRGSKYMANRVGAKCYWKLIYIAKKSEA